MHTTAEVFYESRNDAGIRCNAKWDAFEEYAATETLVNSCVEVALGPLFLDADEFHVQTVRSFVMPAEHHTRYEYIRVRKQF